MPLLMKPYCTCTCTCIIILTGPIDSCAIEYPLLMKPYCTCTCIIILTGPIDSCAIEYPPSNETLLYMYMY